MFDRTVETSVDVAAPPAVVWGLLTSDGMGSGSWNPLFLSVRGELKEGAALSVTAALPGRSPHPFRVTVVTVKPEEELRWHGTLPIPGLFTGTHYFRIEPAPSSSGGGSGGTPQGSCRFVQGEHFSGLLVPLAGGILADTEKGFQRMNEALKRAAEQGG
ncbi:hypothetical protein ABPG75_004476 [Micractinium tetrahymenae]